MIRLALQKLNSLHESLMADRSAICKIKDELSSRRGKQAELLAEQILQHEFKNVGIDNPFPMKGGE